MNLNQIIEANRKLHKRYTFRGLKISIENRKGSVRSGVDPDGHEWRTKMLNDYGYIRGTEGTDDGDLVDVFVSNPPNEDAENVYVISIKNPKTKAFDEQKVFLGFESAADARACFDKHYDDPDRFFMDMVEMPFEKFKEKILNKKNHGEKIAAARLF